MSFVTAVANKVYGGRHNQSWCQILRGGSDLMRFTVERRTGGFLHRCTFSRVGLTLVAIHAAWFYFGVRSMGTPSRRAAAFLDSLQGSDWTLFAGRPFHFYYQSWLLESLLLADMPAMLVQAMFGVLALPLRSIVRLGTYEASYINAGSLFVIASLQWLMIGYVIERRSSEAAITPSRPRSFRLHRESCAVPQEVSSERRQSAPAARPACRPTAFAIGRRHRSCARWIRPRC